jgi:hypothetical protein
VRFFAHNNGCGRRCPLSSVSGQIRAIPSVSGRPLPSFAGGRPHLGTAVWRPVSVEEDHGEEPHTAVSTSSVARPPCHPHRHDGPDLQQRNVSPSGASWSGGVRNACSWWWWQQAAASPPHGVGATSPRRKFHCGTTFFPFGGPSSPRSGSCGLGASRRRAMVAEGGSSARGVGGSFVSRWRGCGSLCC